MFRYVCFFEIFLYLCQRILFAAFVGDASQSDDLTLLALKYMPK